MTNFERLQTEIKGIDYPTDELNIYLQENGLNPNDEYDPTSNSNRRNVLKTALSILESLANSPQLMKDYKTDDISISSFSENLQARIDQLERKIRQIPNDEQEYEYGVKTFWFFSAGDE